MKRINLKNTDIPEIDTVDYDFGGSEENFEVLPLVLSEEYRELIEIDRFDSSHIYMFDENQASNSGWARFGDDIAQVEDIDKGIELLGEAEGIEEALEKDKDIQSYQEPAGIFEEVSPEKPNVQIFPVKEILSNSRQQEEDSIKDREENSEKSTIEFLITTVNLDFISEEDKISENLFTNSSISELKWTPRGLDLDQFIHAFADNDTNVYKALMKISRYYKAIKCILSEEVDSGMKAEFILGMEDKSGEGFLIRRDAGNMERVVFRTWSCVYQVSDSNTLCQ